MLPLRSVGRTDNDLALDQPQPAQSARSGIVTSAHPSVRQCHLNQTTDRATSVTEG
jgi:hypothetical protein